MTFITWVSAWLECIKCNSNFTQMIMMTPKCPSTIKWWLTYPPRASTMVRSRCETLTTYHRECLYDECIALNSASVRIFINVCKMCQRKLQAVLDIQEGLTAQKYIDKIVRPHVETHVDNYALTDSTVLMRGGAKPHAARISQDVLAMRLASHSQPRIQTLASLWTYVQKHKWYKFITPNCCCAAEDDDWQNITQASIRLLMASVQRGLHDIAKVSRAPSQYKDRLIYVWWFPC